MGTEFLRLVWEQEDECERQTAEALPGMGQKAPQCVERLGDVLSFLDRMASCWWSCAGGDHLIEYLCGRASTNARAAFRLLHFGFYDEALTIARGVGELANLLCLLAQDSAALADWKKSSKRDRLQKYSPYHVRMALESRGLQPPISQERYASLSERAAHVTPDTVPQAHNVLGVPVVGAVFQEAGTLVSLNELALAVSIVAAFGALLLKLDGKVRMEIISAGRALAETVGGATITEIDEYYSEVLRRMRELAQNSQPQ